MKKKILVMMRRGFLEFEYILPLLKIFSIRYEINTVFLNKKSFISLKNNPYLFKEWKKINKNYYIQKKYDFFFYKLINYILFKIKILDYYREKINFQLHNPNVLLKKVKINHMDKLKYIFTEYGNFSVWLKNFYGSKNRPKIIFFPSAPQIFLYKKNKMKDKKKLTGDLLLTVSSKDKRYWSNFIEKSKIKPIGIPFFNYVKSTRRTKKKLKKTVLIAIAYRYKLTGNDFLKKHTYLFDKLLNDKNDYKIIVKPHPFKQDKYLYKLLDLYKKKYKNFKVSYEALSVLCKKSDVMICNLLTSASIHALFNNIPVISFPFRDEFNLPSDNQKLGLIEKTNSIEDFMKKLKSALYKTDSSVWIRQNKNFKKIYFENKKTNNQVYNFIENYKYEKY